MNWFAFVWKFLRDTVFRKAVTSILWPRIGRPFLIMLAQHIFEEGYEIVKRSVATTEQMYLDGQIQKEDKPRICLELIENDAKSKGVELSAWAKNFLTELALGELEDKWEEFQ